MNNEVRKPPREFNAIEILDSNETRYHFHLNNPIHVREVVGPTFPAWSEYFGCFTGDCPHDNTNDCVKAIREFVKKNEAIPGDDSIRVPRKDWDKLKIKCAIETEDSWELMERIERENRPKQDEGK